MPQHRVLGQLICLLIQPSGAIGSGIRHPLHCRTLSCQNWRLFRPPIPYISTFQTLQPFNLLIYPLNSIMPAHLVFGAGGIGTTAKSFTFTWDTPEKVSELLLVLDRIGVTELDSAASYPPGNPWNTETLLGQSKAAAKGFIIDSKVAVHGQGPKLHDSGVGASIDQTLELLGTSKIRTLYAHSPDPETSLEDQAAAFDKQYRAGKFERVRPCVPETNFER